MLRSKKATVGLWALVNPKAEVCAGLGVSACQEAADADSYVGKDFDKNWNRDGEWFDE